MSKLIATRHAKERMQQRAISEMEVQLLQLFGEDHYQKGGSYVTYIHKDKYRQLREAVDRLQKKALIKSSDEVVITAMHLTEKVRITNYRA